MSRQWILGTQPLPIDGEVLEESALAQAQALIQSAMTDSGINRAQLAVKMGRPRSFVSKMLSGSHNLTIRTLSRALMACGVEPKFQYSPIQWGWVEEPTEFTTDSSVPANQAGIPMLAA